ncbi:MAG: hypothetical protein D6683_02735 [Actinomyces sp.]|nr:MAG: hypothetical protein D6683_02735 [Actinomyces sp.]
MNTSGEPTPASLHQWRFMRRIHWLTAVLVLPQLTLGLCAITVPDTGARDVIARTHVLVGIALVALTAVRVAVRVRHGRLRRDPELVPAWAVPVERVVLAALLVTLLAGVASWLTADTGPAPWGIVAADIDRDRFVHLVHRAAVWVLLAAVAAHALAGIVIDANRRVRDHELALARRAAGDQQ